MFAHNTHTQHTPNTPNTAHTAHTAHTQHTQHTQHRTHTHNTSRTTHTQAIPTDPTYVYRGILKNPDSAQEIAAWLDRELKKPQYKSSSSGARPVYIIYTADPVPFGHFSAVAARGQGAVSL